MSEVPPIDISPEQWDIVRGILQRRVPALEVWAFGSRAKRTSRKYSDLDLCVIADQPLALSLRAILAEAFSESDLPWKVDVVDWAATGDVFREVIEGDRVVLQTRPGVQSRSGAR